jgi:hypothetical protein
MYQRRKDDDNIQDNGNSNIHTLNDLNNNNNNRNNNNNNNRNNDNDINRWKVEDEFRYSDRHLHDYVRRSGCVICYADFNPSDIVQKLTCGHIFHKDCLNDDTLEANRREIPCKICHDFIYLIN